MVSSRHWITLTIAATAGALAACSPGGEAGEAATGESGQEGGAPPVVAAAPGAGGEAGEAGAQAAYAGLDAAGTSALRAGQMAGFLHIAKAVLAGGDGPAAAILIDQGKLEVFDAFPSDFGADAAKIAAALTAASAAADKADPTAAQKIDAAMAALQPLVAKAGKPADQVSRLIGVGLGLYKEVPQADGSGDPIEYQHAFGAMKAAAAELAALEPALSRSNPAAATEAKAAMDGLLALFPATTVGDKVVPYAKVSAQAAKVQLALAGSST